MKCKFQHICLTNNLIEGVMMTRKWITLTIWIAVFQTIGFLLGMMTKDNLVIWYAGLQKSSLTPPGFVFSIVWTILYILLAVIGWTLWRERSKLKSQSAIPLFSIQMLMNWAWTPLFFQMHWLGISFLWLIALVMINGVMIMNIKSERKDIALALTPYWLWLAFATYLNGTIWALN
jgi:translocator protein